MADGGIHQVARRRDDRVIIAHISDLHFKPAQENYRSGGAQTQHLVELIDQLGELQPDFIAFTGDVTDDPAEATFLAAKSFVDDLQRSAKVDDDCIAVVPGNHDLVRSGALPSFGFSLRKRLGWFEGAFGRWTRPYRAIRYTAPKTGHDFNLKIACLNSNSDSWDLNWAGGRVIPDRLKRFRDDMGSAANLEPFTVRVALVHHHLLPIAEAQLAGASGLEKEQFHLLMNAGVVMRAMVACGVELVLHGHRHYSGFARITYPAYAYRFNTQLDDRLKDFLGEAAHRAISVVGAGTCGKPENPTGPYQFNVVSLFLDGRIRVDQFERDSEDKYHPRTRDGIALTDGSAAVATRYRWFLAESFASSSPPVARARCVHYLVMVDEHGDGYGRREVRGFRALDERIDRFPFLVFSDSGYLSDRQQPTVTCSRHGLSVRWEKDEAAVRRTAPATVGEPVSVAFPGFLRFDPGIGHEKADEVEYTVRTMVPNAFRTHLGIHPEWPEERAGFTVAHALVEQLVITLRFQDAKAISGGQVQVEVLDPSRKEDRAEKNRILLHAWEGNYAYTVQRPLPGYRYGLKWQLPSLEEYEAGHYAELGQEDRALAKAYVAKLLDDPETQSAVQILLTVMRVELCRLANVLLETVWKALKEAPKAEFQINSSDVDLSFQVVDPNTYQLRLVAATHERLGAPWSLHYGQGISGLALRRGAAIFHDNRVKEGLPHYLPRSDMPGLKAHSWLFSMPIGFDSLKSMPSRPKLIRWPVGVLNIGSFKFIPAARWFLSTAQVPETKKEIREPLQRGLLDRIYGPEGFSVRLRDILASKS